MGIIKIRAILGVDRHKVLEVLARAQAMEQGMGADPATYSAPDPSLPVFRALIQDTLVAHQRVATRTVGARAERDFVCGRLFSAMAHVRTYVQVLANAEPRRAEALIVNAGLLVARPPVHGKAFLTLRNGKQSGSVECAANVRLLLDPMHPRESRHFNWEYTVDGGETFLAPPATTRGKTTLHGLPPLITVGVRVSMSNARGPGP